jgi:hypothetical protein
MLAISPVLDDETAAPVAKAARTSGYDARDLTRRALKAWPTIRGIVTDYQGFPVGEIWALNPSNAPIDPNRGMRRDGPRLLEFSGPDYREDNLGAWRCLGNGASGKDLVELIQYLAGGCERRAAADYLRSIVERVVEIAA